MSTDQFLVLGFVLGVLGGAAAIAAWADGRVPRLGAVLLVAGLALALHAHVSTPGGYTAENLPDVIYGVIGDQIR